MRAHLYIAALCCTLRAATRLLACGAFSVLMAMPGHANQRPFPVATLSCQAQLPLCRAVVQALSQRHSAHLYRINPKPMPPNAFDMHLDINDDRAKLRWQGDQTGTEVARQGQNDAKFAERIVHASPGLLRALIQHQTDDQKN